MASHRRDDSPSGLSDFGEGEGLLGTGITSRQIEAFGRKVTSTAGHLIGPASDGTVGKVYRGAMNDIHRELRRPHTQRKVFALARTTPTDLVRSKLSTTEIQSRALSSVPDELLLNIPETSSPFSLFQGFQVSLPEDSHRKSRRRRSSKLLKDGEKDTPALPNTVKGLKQEREELNHRLETMGIRKNMCSSEIHEIDNKIANLHGMRKIILDRLAGLEMDEVELERQLTEIDNKLEDLDEQPDVSTPKSSDVNDGSVISEDPAMDASFMSESIYQKMPSPSSGRLKHKSIRKRSMPILHEHFEPGSLITEIQAHNDIITAVDFDFPFGTMVSAALDDTVKVWDLSSGRCNGFLEGHNASVRCLQMEDNIVATGSMDASIRLWDLSRARPASKGNQIGKGDDIDDEDDSENTPTKGPSMQMDDCYVFSLESHLDEVTALHFRGETLVSGSADKTMRQWDLTTGRCVQTLDVLWAAAQASATGMSGDQWRPTGRLPDASADFVGALQCFDAALACGTADGMVRLWDLRSGQVHRSLVGHTGPVTSLQFDNVHLVTGSLDRSIRVWDLRTGSIYDAFAYDKPVTSMMFDAKRIVAAAGENVVKVYDKADGRHWDCGSGVGIDERDTSPPAVVERVRIKDGYLLEGRTDGMIGAWTC